MLLMRECKKNPPNHVFSQIHLDKPIIIIFRAFRMDLNHVYQCRWAEPKHNHVIFFFTARHPKVIECRFKCVISFSLLPSSTVFLFIPNKYLEEAQAHWSSVAFSEPALSASLNQTCITHMSAAFQYIWIMCSNCTLRLRCLC